MSTPASSPDEVRRFIFENQPVRGHWVCLDSAWRELRTHNDYPPQVRELLGQAVSASVLLAATLKFEGQLTLQLEGSGVLRLLVAQCTHDFRVRAVARFEPGDLPDMGNGAALTPQSFRQLVGESGRLIVTIEAAERDVRYQGIVPLTGASVAESLEEYFASSEQLPTRVQLAADGERAVGLLVQKLPGTDDVPDADVDEGSGELSPARTAWDEARSGIGTVSDDELLRYSAEEALQQSFAHRDLRLFRGSPVRFSCRCSQSRVAGLLRALGADEVRDVLREQGSVTVTCEFCQKPYRFDEGDVERLFAPSPDSRGSRPLH